MRRIRRTGARPLATRRKRRKGARRRGESMKIGVVGAGAWGTALAQSASTGGQPVLLWALERDVVEAVNTRRENPTYLAGVPLSSSIRATSDLAELQPCD